MKRKLLDTLAARHDFDVPVSMVDGEFEQIWSQLEQEAGQDADPATARTQIEAERGELRQGTFILGNTWELEPGRPPVRHATYTQSTTITLAQIQDSFAEPKTLSVWDLPEFIAVSQAAGFSALPHRLYLQTLMAMPLMLCAMVLLAASFFLTSQARMAGWTVRGAAGVASGFVLYFFSQFTYALGLSATLPIVLAAWAPAAIALLLSLAFLFYREDG